MKTRPRLLLLPLLLTASLASADDFAGVWTLSIDTPRGLQHPVLTVNEEDGQYSGTYEGRMGLLEIESISRDGNRFEFPLTISVPIGDIDVFYSGTTEGDSMEGVVRNPRGEVPFSGVRE
ncbi:MAG: hypothetical protein AAGE43_17365 [Pseudomonadota bacterium]